jgi:hypothetical protein
MAVALVEFRCDNTSRNETVIRPLRDADQPPDVLAAFGLT